MSLAPRITDERGTPALRQGGAWVLDEARRWFVQVEGPPCEARLGVRALAWDAQRGGVLLDLRFAVGALTLELRRDAERVRVPLQVRPAPAKLETSLWERLLEDLEAWLPGLSTGADGARQGAVGTAGVSAPLLVEALLPLLPALERALRQLLAQPRRRAVDRLEERPLHHTRAADRETVSWLARHPREAAWLNPERSFELSGPPPTLEQRGTWDTLDHPANRYVVWLIGRVLERLQGTAEALEALPRSEPNDTWAWARARAAALRAAHARLSCLMRRGPLRALRPQPASEGALLVVLDHPIYARVHRLGRRVITARFSLDGEGLGAATRPSFELYELWCFLAVQRALAAQLGPELPWAARGLGALLRLSGSGAGAQLTATPPWGRVELHFNPSFTSALRPRPAHGRVSLSAERRPDLVLAVQAGERRRWLALDAKYRVGARSLGDAFTSVHLYRDALRWADFGGACVGGYLLAPKRTQDADLWFKDDFHREHHMGALELRPGAPPSEEAAAVLAAMLSP